MEAMDKEKNSLIKIGTYTPLKTLPPGKTPLDCKWVYKMKRNEFNCLDKFKAQWWANTDTNSSPTSTLNIKHSTIKIWNDQTKQKYYLPTKYYFIECDV